MTPRQLTVAIDTCLQLAQTELDQARQHTGLEHASTWAACLTASKVFSGLAHVFINLRELEHRNAPTEKNLPEL